MRILFGLILIASTTGCGHFQMSGGGMRGLGEWKTSSDYATPSRPAPAPTEMEGGATYQPKEPFYLSWPVKRVRISRGYRPTKDPAHEGIDLSGARNADILAAHEGVVIYAGNGFRGYGKMVMIEYNREWATLYAHLNSVDVREGQIVALGDRIGGMGRTGRTTGVHLHFELLRNRQPVDPMVFLSTRTLAAKPVK